MADLTLARARKRLLKLVDDMDFARFNDDEDEFADLDTAAEIRELDYALVLGQEKAWHRLVSANRSSLAREGSVTSSTAGVVDLSSLDPVMPLLAVNEYESSTGTRWPVLPGNLIHGPTDLKDRQIALRVLYVPRIAFPGGAATAFSWSHANVTAVKQVEELMLQYAAQALLATEGKENPLIEKTIERLQTSLDSTYSGADWECVPIDDVAGGDYSSEYMYVQTAPDQLQLVWR